MSGYTTNGLPAASFPLTGPEQAAFDTELGQGIAPESEAISIAQIKGFERAPSTLVLATNAVATNAALSGLYEITLTGNATLTNPTNLQAGSQYKVIVVQDGTGARTLAFGSAYKFSGSSTLTTTAGAIDMLSFVSDDGTRVLGTLAAKFA